MLFRSAVKKAGVLPQRELVSIKIGGAAATRNGKYKKRGRCRKEIGAVTRAGALPQGDQGSKKLMALPVSIKIGGAAATRNGQNKKRGRCRSENWSL